MQQTLPPTPERGHPGALSLRRMFTAQAAALVIGFPAALMMILPVGAAFESLRLAGIDARVVGFLNSFLLYFIQAAVLGMVQWLLIRRAVPNPLPWVLSSGLAGVALMPSLFPLTMRLVMAAAAAQPSAWVLVACSALVGAVFGAALGFVQSLWMEPARARWRIISTAAWALTWAAGFPIVYLILYLH